MVKAYKKKITIIVSMIGLLASILGIIVTFFPNILNLEKGNIEKFELEISSKEDAYKLGDFLEKHPSELVELSIVLCIENFNTSCSSLEKDVNFSSYEDSGSSLTIYSHNEENKNCEDTYPEVVYAFGKAISGYNRNAVCKNYTDDLWGVEVLGGYFIVPPSSGYGQGITEWLLEDVDSKEILLKKY